MSNADVELSGPDLCQGIALSALTESVPLLGHAQGEPTIVVRRGNELFAIGAVCTHYSGPLAEGLVEGDTVRCPWHHACFSLRTGEALRAPALNPVSCRRVELRDGKVYVGDRIFEDVHGPQQVGMRAIWIPHSDIPANQRVEVTAVPDGRAHELLDVLALVDAWTAA